MVHVYILPVLVLSVGTLIVGEILSIYIFHGRRFDLLQQPNTYANRFRLDRINPLRV